MSRLDIRAEHLELRKLRPWLDELVLDLDLDLDPTLLGRIELCIHELASNVVDHSGAAEFSLELSASPDRITVVLSDGGAPLAVPSVADLEPHPRVRGYGMMIAEHLASELTYERRGAMNLWHVEFAR